MKYTVELSPAAECHLDDLSAHDRKIVLTEIDKQLTHQPTTPTRNRKLLRANPLAAWELRVGQYRVLYNVIKDQVIVAIVAVAVKKGNKFIIGGEEHVL
ncbi:MAG: type II toxin-antitoxin system RelE/ParE family toxin [Planctomycetes bacterium]|nr:type II toxin-antitoxin system RelE/ParE family toxin [Planctomycetota bacterium]